jgi:hypothetical protein
MSICKLNIWNSKLFLSLSKLGTKYVDFIMQVKQAVLLQLCVLM